MAVDPHKNFAYSLVAGGTIGAAGTSLVVTAGQGALFPPAVTANEETWFNATVWAVGANPITTNSEIVRVSNVSTDTLTIVRTTTTEPNNQNRTIVVGDQIAATITAHTLMAAETYTVNVDDYGAKGDGSTDDLTAIQAAINAAGALGVSSRGVDVFFPSGVYAVSGTITCNFNNVMLIGSGWESTVIYCTSITGDVIQFGDNSTVYAGCGLRSMSVWKSAQGTTGFNINIRRMNDVVITDFVVNQGFSGINILGAGSGTSPPTSVKTWIQRGEINACAATGVGITINNANPAAAGDTYLDNLVFSQGGTTTGTAGINIINTGHLSILRCNVTNYITGLLVNPGDTQSVNYLFIDHCLFDSCDRAAEFSSTGATPGVIKSVVCVNSWFAGSAVDYGIYFNGLTAASLDGFSFTGCRILNNFLHGVLITLAQNINFTNCIIAGNGLTGSGTNDGVNIASAINNVSIIGCRIGRSGTATNVQRYAINVGGGASSNLKFKNNDLSTNVTVSTTTPYPYINVAAALTGTDNEIGSPIMCTQWRPPAGGSPGGLSVSSLQTIAQSVPYFQPMVLHQHLSAYKMVVPGYFSTTNSATNNAANGGVTLSMAIYSRGTGANSTRLESLLSRSAAVTYSMSSSTNFSVTHPLLTISNSTAISTSQYGQNNGTAITYLQSTIGGGHLWVFPISSTLTPGEYWVGLEASSTTGGTSVLGLASGRQFAMYSGQGLSGGWAHMGQVSSAAGAGINYVAGWGTAAGTAAWPATINLSAAIRAANTQWMPFFEINANATSLSEI